VIPAHLITLGIAWAVITNFGRFPFWKAIGWSWPKNFGFFASVGLAILLLIVGGIILSRFGGQETELERIIMSSRLNAMTTAFLATFTAPLVEEVIYRGVLYSALQRTVGMIGAMVYTNRSGQSLAPSMRRNIGIIGAVALVMSLFTAVHVPQYWPNLGVLSAILLLSFSLTVIRAWTGRLLPCFVIHLVFNGLQSFFIVAGPYLPDVDKLLQRRVSGLAVLIPWLTFHC
jgi:membrane protease YdiL (CAAX protease family)